MAILMGRWDCDSCGTKGVMGDAYNCHSCGAGRPEDVKFYLPRNAEVITDAAGIRAANAGSDWKCEYCGEWVAATEKQCPDCAGGSIGGSKRQVTKTYAGGPSRIMVAEPPSTQDEYAGNDVEPVSDFIRTDHDEVLREHAEDPPERKREPAPEPGRKKKLVVPGTAKQWRWGGLIAGGVGLFALLMWAIFHTVEVPATMTHHSWERRQAVQEFTRGINRDGWDHPSDAYSISTSRKIHHYNKVFDHTERQSYTEQERYQSGTEPVYSTRTVDLGNGRFRSERYQSGTRPVYSYRTVTKYRNVDIYRDEPEYRAYYHYKVDRWLDAAPRITSGLGLEPKWPSTAVRDEDQRMGGRTATYRIHFLEEDPEDGEQARTWMKDLGEGEWRAWKDDTPVILVVNSLGIREIKTLENVEAE